MLSLSSTVKPISWSQSFPDVCTRLLYLLCCQYICNSKQCKSKQGDCVWPLCWLFSLTFGIHPWSSKSFSHIILNCNAIAKPTIVLKESRMKARWNYYLLFSFIFTQRICVRIWTSIKTRRDAHVKFSYELEAKSYPNLRHASQYHHNLTVDRLCVIWRWVIVVLSSPLSGWTQQSSVTPSSPTSMGSLSR